MIWFLRILFSVILLSMLAVTSWASMDTALWEIPREVAAHPWFVAALFDAYFGFITFFVWVAYLETRWAARIGWLVGILCFGNIAMAIYMLIRLFRVSATEGIERLLLREEAAA